MEHGKGDLAGLGGIEKADVAQIEASAGDSSPARTSITVTEVPALSVSKIFIWSAVVVMSTIWVMSGWKRISVPRGDSVSNARVGTLLALK
jgi:hypothetical protein